MLGESFVEYRSLYTDQGYAATTPESETIKKRFAEGRIWVALLDERIVGTVSVVAEGESLYVRSMAIVPAARGSRIGERLLAEVERFAVAHNWRRLFLSTTPFLHRAIRLYEKFGFERTGEPPHNLYGTPLVTMSKTLTSTAASEMKFTVRNAIGADAAVLARFRYELRAISHEIVENEAMFIERCTAWMREQLRGEGNWKCWIAEAESKPVGSVWAQRIEKIPNPIAEPEHYVYLTNFYVQAEHRSQGIGSLLLEAVVEWSKNNDAELVLLTPTERSKPLYLRHGFFPAEKFMTLKLKR